MIPGLISGCLNPTNCPMTSPVQYIHMYTVHVHVHAYTMYMYNMSLLGGTDWEYFMHMYIHVPAPF